MVDTICTRSALVVFKDSAVRENLATKGHAIGGQVYQIDAKFNFDSQNNGFCGRNTEHVIVSYLSKKSKTTKWQRTDKDKWPVSKTEKQRLVHVGGLIDGINHDDLGRYFSKFGTVTKVVLATTNRRKFVVMFTDSVVRDSARPSLACYTKDSF